MCGTPLLLLVVDHRVTTLVDMHALSLHLLTGVALSFHR